MLATDCDQIPRPVPRPAEYARLTDEPNMQVAACRWSSSGRSGRSARGVRDAGADCVEMESAALYAYAAARGRDVLCLAHVTNTMAVSGDDFEKGQANGALAAIAITAAIAQVLRGPPGGP